MADPTADERKAFAKSGWAMPDGSYYVRPGHPEDLANAVKAVGRAAGSDGTTDEEQRNAVRKHIIKRAKETGREDAIPARWNPDGTLKTAAQHSDLDADPDLRDADDILEHFGVKGMKWGSRKSPAELESKASAHEAKATAYTKAAKQLEADHADLMKNGTQSRAFKRVYGQDAHMQNDWSFYARNGQSHAEALRETSNNLRVAHNSYARAANRHASKAVKIRAQLATTQHSEDDANEFLEHFGRKGMKWGEHIFGGSKSGSKSGASAPEAPKAKASVDASRAEKLSAKASTGTHTLSNKELQDLVTRMNLEQQYSKLTTPAEKKKAQKGQNFVQKYNSHTQTGLSAIKTTREVIKIVGPLLVAGAAAAAASKAGGHSGPVKMPRLAIGS